MSLFPFVFTITVAFCLPDSCGPERILTVVPPCPATIPRRPPSEPGRAAEGKPHLHRRPSARPTSEALSLEGESLSGPGRGMFAYGHRPGAQDAFKSCPDSLSLGVDYPQFCMVAEAGTGQPRGNMHNP